MNDNNHNNFYLVISLRENAIEWIQGGACKILSVVQGIIKIHMSFMVRLIYTCMSFLVKMLFLENHH